MDSNIQQREHVTACTSVLLIGCVFNPYWLCVYLVLVVCLFLLVVCLILIGCVFKEYKLHRIQASSVGCQNRKYTSYMTICLVIFLLKIPYVHRIYL